MCIWENISMQICPTDYYERPFNIYQIKILKGRSIALLSVTSLYYTERIRVSLFLCHHLSVRFSHTRCSHSREKISSPQSDIFQRVDTYPVEWFYRRGCHSQLWPEWSGSLSLEASSPFSAPISPLAGSFKSFRNAFSGPQHKLYPLIIEFHSLPL